MSVIGSQSTALTLMYIGTSGPHYLHSSDGYTLTQQVPTSIFLSPPSFNLIMLVFGTSAGPSSEVSLSVVNTNSYD